MKTIFAIALVLSAARDATAGPFVEPQAYPIGRYEAGWQKNPFTLKTAPVAVQKESFAKDLALAGWRQAGDDTIVILVNTKTREYSRLKNQEPAPDGTKVKTAHLEDRRGDTFVELERYNDTAVVRYDESFLRQMAAQGTTPKTATPQVPMQGRNAPAQALPPGVVVNPPNVSSPQSGMAPNITPPPTQSLPPGIVPPMPVAPGSQPGAGATNNVPTVQRRRLNTMPQPVQP